MANEGSESNRHTGRDTAKGILAIVGLLAACYMFALIISAIFNAVHNGATAVASVIYIPADMSEGATWGILAAYAAVLGLIWAWVLERIKKPSVTLLVWTIGACVVPVVVLFLPSTAQAVLPPPPLDPNAGVSHLMNESLGTQYVTVQCGSWFKRSKTDGDSEECAPKFESATRFAITSAVVGTTGLLCFVAYELIEVSRKSDAADSV